MSHNLIQLFGSPVLREECVDIGDIDDSVMALAKDLEEICVAASGIGLAANQIGVLRRAFVMTGSETEDFTVYINPKILSLEGDSVLTEEGCLSLPMVSLAVPRIEFVKASYLGIDGEEAEIELEGIQARAFQHELDHLNGRLILDRVDKPNRIEAIKILTGQKAV